MFLVSTSYFSKYILVLIFFVHDILSIHLYVHILND